LVHLVEDRIGRPKLSQQSWASYYSEDGEVRYPTNIRWTCIRCTNSCSDIAGHKRIILLTSRDIRRITDATRLDPKEFSVSARVPAPYEKRMKKRDGKCIFLRGSGCSIYKARPLICRFYPFCISSSGAQELQIGVDLKCSGMGNGPKRGQKFFCSLVELAKTELTP
jgi:Fe-S-cluster containining protein